MPKISKKSTTLLVIVVCVFVIAGVKIFFQVFRLGPDDTIAARAKGNPEGAIRITEYVDFQCRNCARGARYLSRFMNDHPDQVYLELKFFSTSGKHSLLSARFAECAARQGKFWPFHDLLIRRQHQWKKLADAHTAFEQMAKDIDLDLSRLEKCLEDKSIAKLILKEKTDAKSLGIRRTPTYFVNGTMVVGLKSLKQELKQYFGGSDH